MSSKSSSSSRQSSPRAMPVETIITRFKSAQQKKKLREMDRSMTKVTELLRNPIKPRVKRKAQTPVKNDQKCNNISSDREEGGARKKKRNNKPKIVDKVEEVKEFCPLKLKRHVALNKISLKPKHELKVIAQTNKRKRTTPRKGLYPQDYLDLSIESDYKEIPEDGSFNGRKYDSITFNEEKSVVEMIQLIEESGSFGDEDLLEILTCPSPVWWEEPPDGFNEDALFTRPRSTAEMYPSVRSQLQEHLGERRRSSTPNVLSRREKIGSRRLATTDSGTNKDKEELSSFHNRNNNNNDNNKVNKVLNSINNDMSEDTKVLKSSSNNNIDIGISLSDCDDKFIKKRSKLEMVLGNLKDRNTKNSNMVERTMPIENTNGSEVENNKSSNDSDINDTVSNKVSVIKNICANDEEKGVEKDEDGISNLKSCIDNEPKASVTEEISSENSDDENLTDISFHDDGYLNDLENMDIPMQQNAEIPKQDFLHEKEAIQQLNDTHNADIGTPNTEFLEQSDKANSVSDNFELNGRTLIKCQGIDTKGTSVNSMHSDKESSMMEDFLEMKLIEEDESLSINNEQNDNSKSTLDTFKTKPLIWEDDCKQSENNLATSVIKFKNSDDTRINIVKIEGVVPKNLPPLINSDLRKRKIGRIPEDLPPLKRNPGVIKVNLGSPKLMQNTTTFDASESCSSSMIQDNMDSISDTNICFLNEEEDDCDNVNNLENSNDFDVSGVIKWHRVIEPNELLSYDPNLTQENKVSINEIKVEETSNHTTNELYNTQQNLYNNISHIEAGNSKEYNDLEYQSLTITKVNNSSCSKLKNIEIESITVKKNDVKLINYDEIKQSDEDYRKTDDLITINTESCVKDDCNKSILNKIETNANDVSETLTIYKIVSDSSGNEESENDLHKTPTKVVPNKDLQHKLNGKESNLNKKCEESIVHSDNKDKMVFYYKKWKNNYWKANDINKIADKKVENEDNKSNLVNEEDKNLEPESIQDKVNSIKITSTDQTEIKRKETQEFEYKRKKAKPKSKKLKDAATNEEKSLNDTDKKQMRYCMKCSSIFDTPQCSYCYRRNSTDNIKETTTDYTLRMDQCFICDICRYKAVTKDSLERHFLLCHDVKKR